jgi:hypothetical protein
MADGRLQEGLEKVSAMVAKHCISASELDDYRNCYDLINTYVV